MLQTLFVIPDWLFHGWLTIAWLVAGLLWLAWQVRRSGWNTALRSALPFYLIVAAILHFVFPRLSVEGVNPADPAGPLVPLGLAIRGYGLCLMLAILLALGLVFRRSRQSGVDTEKMFTLCFWMVIAGLAGARVFYVVQKKSSFEDASWLDLLDMTKGGLVVYGSLIGGLLAVLVFCRWNRMRLWPTLDILAPAMLLGLAIGRIGCLLNGCCYGGECGDFPLALRFPAGSAPYMDQLESGRLLGIRPVGEPDEKGIRTVQEQAAPGLKGFSGLKPGERFLIESPDPLRIAAATRLPDPPELLAVVVTGEESGTSRLRLKDLPQQSLPVHPAQVYAALNAGLLAWILWLLGYRRRFEGEVFATLMVAYPVGRFLEEVIRQDEKGIFGTALTISQWISLILLVTGMAVYLWLYSRRPRLASAAPLAAGVGPRTV